MGIFKKLKEEQAEYEKYVETTARYRVVGGANEQDLTRKVNEKIDEGWKPVGGISFVMVNSSGMQGFQAMVREKRI